MATPMLAVTNTVASPTMNGRGEDAADPVDALVGVVERPGRAVEHHEVVATGAGDAGAEAVGGRPQPLGQRDQHAIGGVVPERVVDVLEAVDVDLDQRRVMLRAPGVLEHVGDAIEEARRASAGS